MKKIFLYDLRKVVRRPTSLHPSPAFSFVTIHCLVAWLCVSPNGGRIGIPKQMKEKVDFVCLCMRLAIKVSLRCLIDPPRIAAIDI